LKKFPQNSPQRVSKEAEFLRQFKKMCRSLEFSSFRGKKFTGKLIFQAKTVGTYFLMQEFYTFFK
jgi:hypothetical protein